MSKLTESFRTIGINNANDFAEKGNVYIAYYPEWNSRSVIPSRSFVYRPGYNTDPEAAWYDHKTKTFSGNKATSVEEAKAWASERYGIKEWAKTPYGDWMDADFVKKRVAELKALVKAKT